MNEQPLISLTPPTCPTCGNPCETFIQTWAAGTAVFRVPQSFVMKDGKTYHLGCEPLDVFPSGRQSAQERDEDSVRASRSRDFAVHRASPSVNQDAQAEIELLKQELSGQTNAAVRWYNSYLAAERERERDELRAKLEAKPDADVVRDALRYRWLCDPANEANPAWRVIQEIGTGKKEFDAAIDAAMEPSSKPEQP